jgi:hypothetical protein
MPENPHPFLALALVDAQTVLSTHLLSPGHPDAHLYLTGAEMVALYVSRADQVISETGVGEWFTASTHLERRRLLKALSWVRTEGTKIVRCIIQEAEHEARNLPNPTAINKLDGLTAQYGAARDRLLDDVETFLARTPAAAGEYRTIRRGASPISDGRYIATRSCQCRIYLVVALGVTVGANGKICAEHTHFLSPHQAYANLQDWTLNRTHTIPSDEARKLD